MMMIRWIIIDPLVSNMVGIVHAHTRHGPINQKKKTTAAQRRNHHWCCYCGWWFLLLLLRTVVGRHRRRRSGRRGDRRIRFDKFGVESILVVPRTRPLPHYFNAANQELVPSSSSKLMSSWSMTSTPVASINVIPGIGPFLISSIVRTSYGKIKNEQTASRMNLMCHATKRPVRRTLI
jgi:hypothetical protein